MLIYACNRQSARYEQSTPLPRSPQNALITPSSNLVQPPLWICMETKLFGATNFARLPGERKRIEWVLKGECGRERAEVCEKLVSEVNKSICHNQFRCKIPSLLGQISLFLFQREGEQKKSSRKTKKVFAVRLWDMPRRIIWKSCCQASERCIKDWVDDPIDNACTQQGIQVERVHTTQLNSKVFGCFYCFNASVILWKSKQAENFAN